ncbi:GNAT family N-acetyltransferase [Streptomyces sp. NBC_00887]|uniref:GNAT family N-acetyltransferase n=1 Tax=Streptomyces sp. NBC_00887 TaxID=2975859 RepID=UPI003862FB94|nr:GNAT family N-acetyltransferase [Streptomyces sp. NBC_00887]WSY36233.1 GNAT family N-acetyltransferase [Streptomyces sp. NBC_00887]
MPARTNEWGQSIGDPVPEWSPRPLPVRRTLSGRHCRLEALDPERHAKDVFSALRSAPDDRDWTYMAVGPFSDAEEYRLWAADAAAGTDPLHYAVVDNRSERAVGTLSLMRQDPAGGVIEVGNVMFSPLLKRTVISTEAQFLLMTYVFDDLGYRRYEWKCDSLNAPSRRAAERLGFSYEGTFRQAVVYKGRNRDTAWFSIVSSEWPALRDAFGAWLAPANFDTDGIQRRTLAQTRACTAAE